MTDSYLNPGNFTMQASHFIANYKQSADGNPTTALLRNTMSANIVGKMCDPFKTSQAFYLAYKILLTSSLRADTFHHCPVNR